MGQKTNSVSGSSDEKALAIRAEMAQTRSNMDQTIDELHGKLNPSVLKGQVLESFQEVKETVKEQLKQEFNDAKATVKAELADAKESVAEQLKTGLAEAKETVKAELSEAKESVKAELSEAKDALKSEVLAEFEAAKTKVSDEIDKTKLALREATIGKVENMVHSAQDKVIESGNSIMRSIRTNPIPYALIGTGLAWLFVNRGQRSNGSSSRAIGDESRLRLGDGQGSVRGAIDRVSEKASDAAHSMSEKASGMASSLSEKANGMASSLSEKASGMASSLSEKASEVGSKATDMAHNVADRTAALAHQASERAAVMARATKEQAQRLEQYSVDTYKTNPIAVGAVVLAAGTAIGLALPRTRREDEIMGSTRDEVLKSAEGLAHEALDKVGEVAKQLASGSMNNNGRDTQSSSSKTTESSDLRR